MSFSDKPREPRAPRKARPRLSLKMQAIGFLSRREHSRQELRAKLLDALSKRAREDAALAAASQKAAQELAEALSEQPSNGIDDAFAPPGPSASSAAAAAAAAAAASSSSSSSLRTAARARDTRAPTPRAGAFAGPPDEAAPRAALHTLGLADGTPLPASMRALLAPSGSSALAAEPAASRSPSAGAPSDDELEGADPEAAVDRLLDWLAANNYLSEARFVESRVNARSRKQGTLRIKLELSRHGLTLEPEQAASLRETEFARAQALWQRKFGAVAADARLRAKQARFLAARGFAPDVVRRVVGGEDDD